MATSQMKISNKYIAFAENNPDLQDKITKIVSKYSCGITIDELLIELKDNNGIDKEILETALYIIINWWCTYFNKMNSRIIYSNRHKKYFNLKSNHPNIRDPNPDINIL